jgi:hypothetical protein
MAIIYRHRKAGTQEVFYIGISVNKYRPYEERRRTKYWGNIVNKYGFEVDIIFNDISYEEAKEGEKLLIKLYGRKDLGLGPLVNMTDGGEGTLGRIVSEETRKKISDLKKGNKYFLGKKHNEITKKVLSEKLKDRLFSEETKKQMSDSHKGVKFSEERMEKIKQRTNKHLKTEDAIIKSGLSRRKIILNIETGIFYSGLKEAADTINMNYKILSYHLNNGDKNKTKLKYV